MFYPETVTREDLYSLTLLSNLNFSTKSKIVGILTGSRVASAVREWVESNHQCPTCKRYLKNKFDTEFLAINGECLGCDNQRLESPAFVGETNENNR